VAPKDEQLERRRYSFVDVLERVSDGVHVQIVSRAADARDEENHAKKARHRERPPAHSRRAANSRRR